MKSSKNKILDIVKYINTVLLILSTSVIGVITIMIRFTDPNLTETQILIKLFSEYKVIIIVWAIIMMLESIISVIDIIS